MKYLGPFYRRCSRCKKPINLYSTEDWGFSHDSNGNIVCAYCNGTKRRIGRYSFGTGKLPVNPFTN